MGAITWTDVAPRDGLQNVSAMVGTDAKVRLIAGLLAAGVPRVEATSFVSPTWVPQLADAAEVLREVEPQHLPRLRVLIPNRRGLEMALANGIRNVLYTIGATDSFNRRNVNRSVEESLTALEEVIPRAREEGLRCEAVIAVAFGCPYEGAVASERVLGIAGRLVAAGAAEIGLGDTTGMANPIQVGELLTRARSELGSEVEITAHFHNTRGQGLANALAALQAGVDSFESSFGELGGCPVPPGATGNIATEDLVSLLHEMGIHTGIDLDALIDCARSAAGVLGRPLNSHTLVAGPVDWHAG